MRSGVNARLPAVVPIVAEGAPVAWGPASVRRVAVSTGNLVETRWRKWLGPAQGCADTARHSASQVRIAGEVYPRVVE